MNKDIILLAIEKSIKELTNVIDFTLYNYQSNGEQIYINKKYKATIIYYYSFGTTRKISITFYINDIEFLLILTDEVEIEIHKEPFIIDSEESIDTILPLTKIIQLEYIESYNNIDLSTFDKIKIPSGLNEPILKIVKKLIPSFFLTKEQQLKHINFINKIYGTDTVFEKKTHIIKQNNLINNIGYFDIIFQPGNYYIDCFRTQFIDNELNSTYIDIDNDVFQNFSDIDTDKIKNFFYLIRYNLIRINKYTNGIKYDFSIDKNIPLSQYNNNLLESFIIIIFENAVLKLTNELKVTE